MPATPSDSSAHQGRRRLPLGALLVLLVLLGSGCAGTGAGPSIGPAQARPDDQDDRADRAARPDEPGATVERLGASGAPGTIPEADALADPGVAPGSCALVTYTPPAAAQPQSGELCRPASGQRDVAVMVVHGGSGTGGTYKGLRPWAERYLAEGYVTFLPDYHLFVPGSRERPVFPRPELNIKAAVQYLRGVARAIGVRRDHVVVQGQSAGARLGAVAFTTPDDPWFAGPERHAGISDAVDAFIGFYHPYDGTMQYADQYFGGGAASRDPATRERLDRGNSLARAAAATGPALFLTGSRDWNLITTQQEAFAAALRARGVEARAVVVESGGHGFDEGDGTRLSRLGEKAALETTQFLREAFM